MHRKTFLQRAAMAAASYPLSFIPWMPQNADAIVMTVNAG
jgi:hypothetical protein